MSWKLVWSDEFDYEGLPDPQKWNYDVGGHGWGNQEAQYYTEGRLENAYVTDGALHISAREEEMEGSHYTSARLVSRGNGEWKYGRVEVRAKLPQGRGTWPAIWMMPAEDKYGEWPACGEIDIMEHVGYNPDVIHASVHTEAYNHIIDTQVTQTIHVSNTGSEYHRYAIEWDGDSIAFFVDDINYLTYRPTDFVEHPTAAEWPFDQKFYLILNIAIGGFWGGAEGIDNSIFPQEMVIDYVRVYQKL